MMSCPKPIPCAPLFFLVILSIHIASFKLSYCMTGNYNSNNILCPEIEKEALLNFKQSLEDPLGQLSSWNNGSEVNCCKWEGVVCNNFTGHVSELHLQNHDYPDSSSGLSGKINPSLLNLKQLRYLDLSQNNFGETIPSFIGSLRSLQYLNLTYAGFHGTIPNTIGNLSNLHTLVLGRENKYNLNANSLEWLSGLLRLKHLNMKNVNLSKAAANWAQVINTLPSLEQVHLNDCNLNFITDSLMNEVNVSSSLAILDFSSNKDRLPIIDNSQSFLVPRWISQLSNLIFLDLNGNFFEGQIPSISNTTKLQHIDLSHNYFNSTIPYWLYSCTDLQFVDLSHNYLHGTISNAIVNLSSLVTLNLSDNELSGKIPREIANLSNMQDLHLSTNKLQGEISDSFGNVSDCFLDSLRFLGLHQNQLSGHLTDQFGEFKHLTALILGDNLLSGALPRVANSLMELDLSTNSFSGGLSHFLCDNITNGSNYHGLKTLYLGENQLTGELPDCFMKWSSLKVLDLGDNSLSGSIPNSIGFLTDLRSLYLQINKFSGQIPFSMHSCTELVTVNLASNNIEGNIPKWMGMSLRHFRILILRSNKLSGRISSNVCLLNSLRILDLSYNEFSGKIPRCVDNFTAMATKEIVNEFDYELYYDGIYFWIFMESAVVSTKGRKYQYDTILPLVTNMDLSNNNLSGDIPKGLTTLVELGSLNLSGNHLTGLIPNNIGDMKQLESLDLSRNSLSGGIPNSFTTMTTLNYLNLSCNNLAGKIPESTQFSTFNASSFIGNHLCGHPLTRNCKNGDEVPAPANKEDNQGDKSEIDWFYVFLSSGFAVGFSVVCSTLMFNKSWRDAYFGFVEDMWDKLYVFFYVKWECW